MAQHSSQLKAAILRFGRDIRGRALVMNLRVWVLHTRQCKAERVAAAHRDAGLLGRSWCAWKSWAFRRELLRTRLRQALALRICRLAGRVRADLLFLAARNATSGKAAYFEINIF